MNKPKARGTAFETAVVRYARDNGFPTAERLALHGGKDIGDIRLVSGVILECKNHATYSDNDVEDWLQETERERINGNADKALLVVKRPYKSVGRAWAIHAHYRTGAPVYMYLSDALHVYDEAGYGDPL